MMDGGEAARATSRAPWQARGFLTMATITAAMVKDLRESTGAGMMDCKAALTESGGDMQAAQDWLRKKGLSEAAEKGRSRCCRRLDRRGDVGPQGRCG